MTVAEILARRERDERASVRSLPSLPSPEDARRTRVKAAIGVVMAEVDRLRELERRDELKRQARAQARAESAAIVEQAQRKFAHRQAARHLKITIDKQFFLEIGSLALKSVQGAQAVELQKELTRIWDREEQLSKGG
jgi:hypothetical protein